MKKIVVTGYKELGEQNDPMRMKKTAILIGEESMDAHDGYHSFTELYDHRIELFIALCHHQKTIYDEFGGRKDFEAVWRSKLHSDGTEYEGWFILGIRKEPGKQITYHLPTERWEDTEFAKTLDRAPEFDGHTSADVIERIKNL